MAGNAVFGNCARRLARRARPTRCGYPPSIIVLAAPFTDWMVIALSPVLIGSYMPSATMTVMPATEKRANSRVKGADFRSSLKFTPLT